MRVTCLLLFMLQCTDIILPIFHQRQSLLDAVLRGNTLEECLNPHRMRTIILQSTLPCICRYRTGCVMNSGISARLTPCIDVLTRRSVKLCSPMRCRLAALTVSPLLSLGKVLCGFSALLFELSSERLCQFRLRLSPLLQMHSLFQSVC